MVKEDQMTTMVCEEAREGLDGFRSRVRVLADWFRRSRDNWKRKYMQAKAELKKYKVRVSDVNQSRDRWKEKAKATERELEALQEELERLRHQVSEAVSTDEPVEYDATPGVEKKGLRKTAAAR
jgi:chromosome segregation ATPase